MFYSIDISAVVFDMLSRDVGMLLFVAVGDIVLLVSMLGGMRF
jgi:hypothetical protein